MKSRTLSKQEIKSLNLEIEEKFGKKLSKKDNVIEVEDETTFLKINGNIDYFWLDEELVPTLKSILRENSLKIIVVDMGAVKFVVSGADIMRPGIVEADQNIKKDEIVSIVDENNKKPLAIGRALLSGEEITQQTSGKSVKNLHYVGDNIWDIE